jgi:hypothetical protein
LLQVGDGYSVCEHPVADTWLERDNASPAATLEPLGLTVMAIHTATGDITHDFASTEQLQPGDALLLYGLDTGHDVLEAMSQCAVSAADH